MTAGSAATAPLAGSPVFGRFVLAAVLGLALLWLAPLLWVLGLSLKPDDVLIQDTGNILSPPFTLRNYEAILANSLVFRWIANSALVALGQTALILVLSSLAGYGFARAEFPGKNVLFVFVLAGLAVPERAIFIPLHRIFSDLGLHNTHAGLILPRLAVPFGVFIMTQYFKAIPREIEEAAQLDNASRLKIFLTIILPLSLPAQAALGIYSFLHAWNDYLWPLVSASKPEMYTLTLGLASTQKNFAQSEGLGYLMAQAVFAALPTLAVYLLFQRHLITAVSGGAVK